MAVRIPSIDTWDQFVWPLGAAMPWAATEVEYYSYRHGHVVDLSPVMLATQLRVTDEEGTYLCEVQALVFEGSVLAYNPARDEVEWVPTRSVANDLSWAEERSAVALANFVPHIPQEAACIARLGACRLMSWSDNSSSEEEGNGQVEEENKDDGQAEEEEGKWEEEDPVDMEEQGEANPKPSSKGRQSERLNHGDNDDRRSGGLSWTRKNLLLLMIHSQTLMPQLVAAPLFVRPRRSQSHHKRLLLRCM